MGLLATLTDKAKELGGTAASKISEAGEIARLNAEMEDIERQIEVQYREIGRIVYEQESNIATEGEDYSVNVSKIDDLQEKFLSVSSRLNKMQCGE